MRRSPRAISTKSARSAAGICRQAASRSARRWEGCRSSCSILRSAETEQWARSASVACVNPNALRRWRSHWPKLWCPRHLMTMSRRIVSLLGQKPTPAKAPSSLPLPRVNRIRWAITRSHHEIDEFTNHRASASAPCPVLLLFALQQRRMPHPRCRARRRQANRGPPTCSTRTASRAMVFEPNRGQTDPQVDFVARGAGYTAFLTAKELVLALHARKRAGGRAHVARRRESLAAGEGIATAARHGQLCQRRRSGRSG